MTKRYEPQPQARDGSHAFEIPTLGARDITYERLDQLTVEILFGVR